MTLKEQLIHEFPLTSKVECSFECYKISKRRYVVFWEDKIGSDDMQSILTEREKKAKATFLPSGVNSIVIVAETDETFEPYELVWFNEVDLFGIFYLKNTENGEIYFNDERLFVIGVGWRKTVMRFNEILQ